MGWTQPKMADALGVKRARYGHWETGLAQVPEWVWPKLRSLGVPVDSMDNALSAVSIQQSILTNLGVVRNGGPLAGQEGNAVVPQHMAQGEDFSATAGDDSMMPLVEPGDTLVFTKTDIPRFGCVVLTEIAGAVWLGVVVHDSGRTHIRPLNPTYQGAELTGPVSGCLVGIVRHKGSRTVTDFDPDGIRLA